MATVILGATGTIGTCVAKTLVDSGRQVLLLGRNEAKLADLATQLKCPSAVVNFQNTDEFLQSIASLPDSDHIDSFVNCVGSLLLKPAHLTTDAEFRDTLETHLFSSFAIVKAAGKILRQRGGAVVLISSAAARLGIANHEAIAAAKAAVEGLAKSAAATYAAQNIRFNVVSPGLVKTQMTSRIWQSEVSAAASTELHALGRLGEPEHIASMIRWLLDPANDWVTAQVIGVDGGLASLQPRRRVQAGGG